MTPRQTNKYLLNRLQLFNRNLAEHHIDAAIISKKESIYYLTHLESLHPLEREAYLLISPRKNILYYSPFIDIILPTPDWLEYLPISPKTPLSQVMIKLFNSKVNVVGIETTNLTVSEYERTSISLPEKILEPIDLILAQQRLIKDKTEIQLMMTAGKIARQAFTWCQSFLNRTEAIGLSEKTIAFKLESKLRQLGADDLAFPTIVAFDQNTAKPHHRPGDTKLKKTSLILIDMGASFRQYKSDMTRTWKRQGTNHKFNQLETIVKQAYHQALQAITSTTITAAQIDSIARNVISKAGYADFFIHSTGHGIGIEAHELPHLSNHDHTLLTKGVSFTIEPGIYLPNQFGYRHENTFIITSTGPVSTTS